MKNFTKQITNKTLFKPTRWLLMALMLLLGTGSAWGAITIYFDNTNTKWSNVYIYLYEGTYWDSNNGSGANNIKWCNNNQPMTHIGNNIYSFTYDGSHSGIVGFTEGPQCGHGNFWETKACYSAGDGLSGGDANYSTDKPCFKPGTTTFTKNSDKTTYYKGEWVCATCCTDYYVAGDAGLCGEGWDAAADKMDCDDNVWTKKFTGVNKGTYYFQITNGTWDVKKGEYDNSKGNITLSNENDGYGAKKIKLTTTSKGDITIYFDGEKAWVDFAEWGIFLVGDEAQLNLGDVKIGESNEVTLKFRYYGVTGISPAMDPVANYTNEGFSIKAHQDASVAPNKYYDVTIRFAPTQSEGTHKALLNMQYAGGSKKFTLTGNAQQSCQSANVAINDNDWEIPAVMCKNVPATFTYSAEANAAVTWSTDNANFDIVDNNKTVTVTYTDDTESSNNVLKYTVSNENGFCPESGVDSGKKLSAQGGVQIAETTDTDQTVCPQGTTTIGVTVGMASYEWKYGEQVMNDKNTNSIEVGAGQYSVTATNANGCVSNTIGFTVTEQEQPITAMNIGFVSGGSTVSSIQACQAVDLKFWATGATRYEIYENIDADNDIANDVKIAEGDMNGDGLENAIVYSISKDAPGTYKFYAKVLNECTSATLEQRTLTVPAMIDAPKYTLTEPTKCGNSETPGSLAITQQVDGISYTIDDIVTNNLTLEAADHIQPQTYTIKATKTTGSCTRTETTEVTVQTINNTPVVNDIAITTANTTVCAGSELTLQLDGEAQEGVTFQWYKGSDAIADATSSSLTIQNVTASDAGAYKLVASKTTPCTVTKESNIKTISVDAKSKIEVSAAESFCLGIPVNLNKKVTDATGTVTWYSNETCTIPVETPKSITVNGNATYYAKAKNGVCPATEAVSYAITAKGVTIISQDPATVHPYEVTTFTASGNASWEISTNPSTGAALDNNDPVFSGKTTAYITKADGETTTFKGEAATGYTISATAEECTITQTFDVVDDPNNCE